MSQQYSLESLRSDRLYPLIGALKAFVLHDSVAITVAGKGLQDDALAAALASSPDSILPLEIVLSRGENVCLRIRFHFAWTILLVDLTAEDTAKEKELHALVKDTLSLHKPTETEWRGVASLANINDLVWTIHDKLVEMSSKADAVATREPPPRLRCFVSFRFDDHSKALAFELRELLELADVEFISGIGFEPRSVSEKVLERLTGQLDLFAVVYTSSGDSAWLNQEIGVARSRKLPVIVLRESDAQIDTGMLGDTEFISFPKDTISKAFVAVLQALRYVRSGNPGA